MAIETFSHEWDRTFNAIADAIFIIDKNHTVVKVNKTLCDMLKAKPEALIGKKCFAIMHKLDKPWPDCPLEKTNTDHESHMEEVNDPAIGVPLLVSTSPIFDEKGEYQGVVHIARDITQRKKMEEELKDRVDKLERFQKVMVDRELKMKELKAEIVALKKRLGEA